MDVLYRTHYGNWSKNGWLFTVNFAVPYIYLPSGSVPAVVLLPIHRFKGTCTAGAQRSFTANDSASARRVLEALELLLVAAPCKPLAKAFREAFGKGFRSASVLDA
jgi:hypothetical protein